MQAQNAHKILLNNLFNARKKKNIRHNRNRKLSPCFSALTLLVGRQEGYPAHKN